jgi:hypothetical protein
MANDIVMHDYDSFNFGQLAIDTQLGKQLVPKGYVNLTAMCQGAGKKLSHWNQTKRSKAFVLALSRSTGIPADLLIVVNESEGSNDERGTWGHPSIAISIAGWISPEFDVWASEVLRLVISNQFTPQTANAAIAQFPKTLTELHKISGIVKRSQVEGALIRDYKPGIDYIVLNGQFLLSDDTFNWLVVSFRSQRGTDISKLPEIIPLNKTGFKTASFSKNARISSKLRRSLNQATSPKREPRLSNVSPKSIENLMPMLPKYGKGVETKSIRVPFCLVEEIKAFIDDQLI